MQGLKLLFVIVFEVVVLIVVDKTDDPLEASCALSVTEALGPLTPHP